MRGALRSFLLWRAAPIILAALFSVGVWALASQSLNSWDEQLGSFSWRFAESTSQEKRIIVVDIDEASIQKYGSWPWSRNQVAELLQKVDAAGASLKVVDIVFDQARPGDERLAQQLASPAPTVIAQVFALGDESPVRAGQLSGSLNMPFCPSASFAARGYIAPTSLLTQRATQVGHVSPAVDVDGAIRHMPALICQDNKAYPALSISAMLASGMTGSGQSQVIAGQSWMDPANWLQIGSQRLPLDDKGLMRISYGLPRSAFTAVSATDVLSNQIPSNVLKGAWVVVGATAFGAGDVITTPLSKTVGGYEVHVQMLSAILDQSTPYTPRWAKFWPMAMGGLITIALLLGLYFKRNQGWVLPLLGVMGVLASVAIHTVALLQFHWWLGWLAPAIFTGFVTLTLVGAELIRTRAERERIFHHLSSYLPESVARQLALSQPSSRVHADRYDATVMCVDIRNFSAFCEANLPEDTANVLHVFYGKAVEIIQAHGGAVEQMVGDGLIAAWNVSTRCDDHGQKALDAAHELSRVLRAQLPVSASLDSPALDIGIGLESGQVLAGSFGPHHRRVHTVLGHTVTVASRLEAMTAELGFPILLGPQLVACTRFAQAQLLGEFLLPGLTDAVSIYAYPVRLGHQHIYLAYNQETMQQNAG